MIKKFHSFILVISTFSIFLLSSCSNPLDKEYHRHTAEDDYRRIVEMEKLDSTQTRLLAKFMVEHGLIGSHILEYHATYRDILNQAIKEDEQKRIEAEKNKVQKNYAQLHTLDKLRNLSKSLKVTIIENEILEVLPEEEEPKAKSKAKAKKPEVAIDKNTLTYKVAFINISQKPIKAFKGDVIFVDLFQSKVKGLTLSNFEGIGVGDTLLQVIKLNLNEASSSSSISTGLKREFIKPEWHPERLIFTDGQIIE
ncbi:MAG: hypothetical protein MUF42_01175 [Cytophagaceae bacterium]|jgi:hypothetical protein|nr:hypothetical protein [Cytophagaceae bacterium]